MDNWQNPYYVGHQHTRSKKRHSRRHVDGIQRNLTHQWWVCGRDPSRMQMIWKENPREWKICSHEGTTKMICIAHVLGQRPASTRENDQDIQRRWWTHTTYDDWGSQRIRIMKKKTKERMRSDNHRLLSSRIGVSNPMGKMVNWAPWKFGNDCWIQ